MPVADYTPEVDSKSVAIWVSLLVGLPLFIYTLTSVDTDQVTQIAHQIKPLYLIGYVALSLLTLVIYTKVWRMFLQSYVDDFAFSVLTLFNFRMAEFAVSFVTPGPRNGGEITSGSLLSSYTHLTQKTATMAAVMETFVLIVTGLIFDTAMVVVALFVVPKSLVLQMVLAMLIAAMLLLFLGWYGLVQRDGADKLLSWLTSLIDIPTDRLKREDGEPKTYAKNHTETVVGGVLWCLVTKVCIAAQMFVLLAGLGLPITFLQAFLLAAAIDIAYSIPSYMGLGALEAGQSAVLSLIGGAASAGVVVAFITRIRDIIFSGYGLLALTYYSSNGSGRDRSRPSQPTGNIHTDQDES
jgi:uncharacterized membrane protein YbhN (UPF0104 family)